MFMILVGRHVDFDVDAPVLAACLAIGRAGMRRATGNGSRGGGGGGRGRESGAQMSGTPESY